MKRLILLLALSGLAINVFSQSTLIWSEQLPLSIPNYYSDYPIVEARADTIRVIGRQNTSNGQRLLIVNYSLQGDTLSTQSLGKDSVSNNSLIDFKFDSFQNVYLLQKDQLGFYKSKVVIQKYSSDGNLIWTHQITDHADTSYSPYSLSLINDSSIFVTTYKEYNYPEPNSHIVNTTSLAQLYYLDSSGNVIWSREFDPVSELAWFSHEIFTHDNTAFIFTNTKRLLKIDLNNTLTINSTTGIENGVSEVHLTNDTNLLVIAGGKYRISKTDLNGSLIWSHYYGTNLPSNVSGDEIRSTYIDSTGNIYVTGRHYGDEYGTPQYSNADILTIKYSPSGSIIWENRYEHGIDNADIANFITLKNGNVYVGGQSQRLGISTDYDYIVLKMESTGGSTIGEYRYNDNVNGNEAVSSIYIFNNDTLVLTGLSPSNSQYGWTTQLLSDVVLSTSSFSFKSGIEVFPNPLSNGDILTIEGNDLIEYHIFSITGEIVQQGALDEGTINELEISKLSSGVFMLQLATDDGVLSTKLLIY